MKKITLLLLALSYFHSFALPVWKEFGSLQYSRYYPAAMTLNEHEVIVMGGHDNQPGQYIRALASCEIIDLKSRSIYETTPMNYPRAEFPALYTQDSNIVAVSGVTNDGTNECTPTVEIFDRQTRSWRVIGDLIYSRRQHIAIFLNPDEILVVGGINGYLVTRSAAEIFNIRTGKSRETTYFPYEINSARAVYSSSGDILVFGGRNSGANSYRSDKVYKFDIQSETWIEMQPLPEVVQRPSVLKLWDGRVICSGGSHKEIPLDFSKALSIEANNKFTLKVNTPIERQWHELAQWSDDYVIIAGGYNNSDIDVMDCYWYQLSTNSIIPAGRLTNPHRIFQLVSVRPKGLQYASILAIGGGVSTTWASTSKVDILEEEYNPPKFLDFKQDCDFLTFSILDANMINEIKIIDSLSGNVSISYTPELPSGFVTVKIEPVDKDKIAYFTIWCKSNATGKTSVHSDTIRLNPRVLLKYDSDSEGRFEFGNSQSGDLNCRYIQLINKSSNKVRVDRLFFRNNIEFSIPYSQFPINLEPRDSLKLLICYKPSQIGEGKDTLILDLPCSYSEMPSYGICTEKEYKAKTRCGNLIQLGEVSTEQSLNMLGSGTLTADNIIDLNFTEGIDIKNMQIEVFSVEGNDVSDRITCSKFASSGSLQIETSRLSAGMYILILKTGLIRLALPYVIMN